MRSDFATCRSGAGLFSRLSATPAIKKLLLITLCCLVLPSATVAQKDNNPYVWDKPSVEVATPTRTRRRAPKKPMLTIRWQLLGLDRQNLEFAAAPSREFADGEFVRMAVQVNQDGYLYLIKHTVEKDGKTTPPTIVSKEVEKVAKNSVAELPVGCEPKYLRNGKCWWRLRKPAGREVITAIFSRNQIRELSDVVRRNPGEEIYVGDNLIFRLTQQSPPPKHQDWTLADQQRHPLPGLKGDYIKMVWNPNPQNNEVLVERMEFTHK